MKVVLFCGGQGTRMRRGPEDHVPKPMQLVGPRPLLWHVMRYYAHFGHKDFILCLGYGAEYIKDYFLHYQETQSNDFVLRHGAVELAGSDIADWTISFVNTGMSSAIGERLRRVQPLLAGEEMFLANYADVLTDAPMNDLIETFAAQDAAASMLVVPPQVSFHSVDLGEDYRVNTIAPVHELPLWENGGYFILRQQVFDHIPEGGDLVADGLQALAKQGKLLAQPHHGFWAPADTVKERIMLEEAYDSGRRPWMLWEDPACRN